MKDLMQKAEIKAHGKEAADYFNKLNERKYELRKTLLTQEEEFKTLKESQKSIESVFKCTLDIIKADQSKNPKAKTADVMKPGIYVE